jgi:CHASE3 domain sensor protein
MTRDRVSFRSNEGWYLVVGFATAIVAAVAVAWASYNDITQYYRWVGWVTHTQSVLVTLDGARGDTFSSVASLQTYFQNGDRKNLDRLELQLSELLRKTAELRALTIDTTPSSAGSMRSSSPNGA